MLNRTLWKICSHTVWALAGGQNNPVRHTSAWVSGWTHLNESKWMRDGKRKEEVKCARTNRTNKTNKRHIRQVVFYKLFLWFYSFCRFRYHCNIEQEKPFWRIARFVRNTKIALIWEFIVFCSAVVFSILFFLYFKSYCICSAHHTTEFMAWTFNDVVHTKLLRPIFVSIWFRSHPLRLM